MLVAPSILSANFNNLLEEVKKVERAEYLHIDVMDGHFVPNISFGTIAYDNLKGLVDMIFDVHLMIDDPLFYAESFSKKADIVTFHYECKNDTLEVINKLKSLGVKVGISIKPKTNPELLLPYLSLVDLVLVMSVEPGFGGQKFLWDCAEKISWLNTIRQEKKLSFLISVDGGINNETGLFVLQKGADIIVSGSSFFDGSLVFEQLKEEVKK